MENKRQDFLLDQNGDFPLEDTYVEDILLNTPYGDSDTQHIVDGIIYTIGSLKSVPTFGFGISSYQNSEYSNSIYNSLNKTLMDDGYSASKESVKKVNGGGFTIDTSFISNIY
jgi:hypothetical protein